MLALHDPEPLMRKWPSESPDTACAVPGSHSSLVTAKTGPNVQGPRIDDPHLGPYTGTRLTGAYTKQGHLSTMITTLRLLALLVLSFAAVPVPCTADTGGNSELDRLRREIEHLKDRLEALEGSKGQSQHRKEGGETKRLGPSAPPEGLPQRETKPASSSQPEGPPAGDRSDAEEGVAAEKGEKKVQIGGAMRFNFFLEDFEESPERKFGDTTFDMFSIKVDAVYRDLRLSGDYRLYPFMQAIHHGWLGYELAEAGRFELGVTQVPFGLLPFSAHNYWLGVDYYIGLAQDYDLGGKYIWESGPWDLRLAFFKNEELGSSTNLERYSFDVVRIDPDGRIDPRGNEETNQFNARFAYTLGQGTLCTHELGVSGLFGQLFNEGTAETGHRWAAAGHLDTRCGRWNLQLQAGRYKFVPVNPPGVSEATVMMGGFESAFDVAAEGTLAIANLAYELPPPWPLIDRLTCYNDYSVLIKDKDPFRDSMLNTTGCSLGIGPVFTYINLIQAKNMVFFGDGSLGGKGDNDWDLRFNINVGYYY